MQTHQTSACGLCSSHALRLYHSDKKRTYWQCADCDLVQVLASERLSSEAEKAIYDTHQNSLEDEGYRRFLSRVFNPLIERLPSNLKGLDFGCGPGPLLAQMCQEVGHQMSVYDLYYADDPTVLETQYDFITCTEVIEHIADLDSVLNRLFDLLKPGGILGMMTKLVIDETKFKTWHYKNDMTHISFFSRKTFEYVASRYDAELCFVGNDVILLTKR